MSNSQMNQLIIHASLHPRAGAIRKPAGKEGEGGASLEKQFMPDDSRHSSSRQEEYVSTGVVCIRFRRSLRCNAVAVE